MLGTVLNQRLARFEKLVPLRDANGRSVQPFLHLLNVDKRLVDGVDLIAHGVLVLGLDKPPGAGGLDRCLLTIGTFQAREGLASVTAWVDRSDQSSDSR